jgi:hypothetical protein
MARAVWSLPSRHISMRLVVSGSWPQWGAKGKQENADQDAKLMRCARSGKTAQGTVVALDHAVNQLVAGSNPARGANARRLRRSHAFGTGMLICRCVHCFASLRPPARAAPALRGADRRGSGSSCR